MTASKYIKGDRVIWMVIILLAVVSLLAVYSSSQAIAYRYKGDSTMYFLIKQLLILLLGLLLVILIHHIPYRFFSRIAIVSLYVALLLLIITFFTGRDINSARRWLELPGTGFTMQPSDFAKIGLLLYISKVLSRKQDKLGELKEAFFPIGGAMLMVFLLIVPSNFSTAVILVMVSMILMFIGRMPLKYLLSTAGIAILIFIIFLQMTKLMNIESRRGTWGARMESFMNSDEESVNNYQVNRAKVAIVNGGILGNGPGNSIQKQKLPQANSDFIYAIIVEEYGLIGAVIILALYIWLFFRAVIIVRRSTRTFAAFVSIGLSLIIVFQALVNMAVAVNLVPVTGQPLPMISSGGTSIVFTSVALGIILSVSWGVEKDARVLLEERKMMEAEELKTEGVINEQ